jgi:hypothetical protein
MAEVVDHCKYKALSSNPSTAKNKKKKERRKEGREGRKKDGRKEGILCSWT